MVTGRVLRFDQVRGYGFIAPEAGGSDVFLHANDLWDDKYSIKPGTVVQFRLEDGERGLKASEVQVVEQSAAPSVPEVNTGGFQGTDDGIDNGDDLCDVLSKAEFTREITELLLEKVPTLTGAQITATRRELLAVAESYKWVEN